MAFDLASLRQVDLLVLLSTGREDAIVRLTSGAVANATSKHLGWKVAILGPGEPAPSARIVAFHYPDGAALAAVRRMRQASQVDIVVCIGSDIYSPKEYVASADVVDFYTVPTTYHRDVLACAVSKPVYVLPECTDAMAPSPTGPFPTRDNLNLCWFGYAESFYKGMLPVLPAILGAVDDGALERFSVVLNRDGFANHFSLPTIEFNSDTFATDVADYAYTVLSHMPSDMVLNSYIKSPNKLITAIKIGMIPIASATPNYRALMSEFGLDRFLFSSVAELDRILRSLDPASDAEAVRSSGIREALLERFSEERVGARFAEIVEAFSRRDASDRKAWAPLQLPPPPVWRPTMTLSQHLQDLLPSAVRALGRRRPRRGR